MTDIDKIARYRRYELKLDCACADKTNALKEVVMHGARGVF